MEAIPVDKQRHKPSMYQRTEGRQIMSSMSQVRDFGHTESVSNDMRLLYWFDHPRIMREVISRRLYTRHKSKKFYNFPLCLHLFKTHKSRDIPRKLKSSDSIVSSCRSEYNLQNMKIDRSSSDIVHLGKISETQSSERLLKIILTLKSRISRRHFWEWHIFSSNLTEKKTSERLSVLL